MFVRQTESFPGGIYKFRARFTVRFESPLNFWNTFANQGVRNDELRFSIVVLFRVVQRIEKRPHVLPVDFLDVETVSFESRGRVFALRRRCGRVERDGVGIVNENEIIETEMSGERARLSR